MEPEKRRQNQRPQDSILTSYINLRCEVEGTRLPNYKAEDNLNNHSIKNL